MSSPTPLYTPRAPNSTSYWPSAMSWTASSHPLLLINVLSLSEVHVPLLIHRSGWPRSRALSPSQTQGHQANMLLCSKPCGQPASSLRAALRATIDPSLPTGPAPKMPTLQPNNRSSEQPNTTPYGGSDGLARTVCNALHPPQATSALKTTRTSHILSIRRFASSTWHRSAKSAFSISDHADVFTANCPANQEHLAQVPIR